MAKHEIMGWSLEPPAACPQHHRHLCDVFIRSVDAGDVLLAPVDVHHFAVLVRMEGEGDTFCFAQQSTPNGPDLLPATFLQCTCGRGYILQSGGVTPEAPVNPS